MRKKERKSGYAAVVVAAIVTVVIMLGGMATGLAFAVRQRKHGDGRIAERAIANSLLIDAATELRHTMSALRLCNETEPVESLRRAGLVYAVRAETALECRGDDWAECRCSEAFLNDVATVLHTYSPERTMQTSNKLYEYSTAFCRHVAEGEVFEYDGGLCPETRAGEDGQASAEDIAAARALVERAAKADCIEYVGDFGGHIEFNIERDGKTGYAVVCRGKLAELAFVREGDCERQTDVERAKRIAHELASACGYAGLSIKRCETVGNEICVMLCRSYAGALACDDCATAVVCGDKVVAFSAGDCDCEHKNIPSPQKTERQASAAAKDGGTGSLVVRTMHGTERVCYEYRYELDDGVHFVYVCAESGKQIDVK